jgi:hypothetical protein
VRPTQETLGKARAVVFGVFAIVLSPTRCIDCASIEVRMKRIGLVTVLSAGFLLVGVGLPSPFQIRVFDRVGRPVPDVILTTDDGRAFTSNHVGVYLWRSDLMGRNVRFHIQGDGTTTLHVTHGGHADLILQR